MANKHHLTPENLDLFKKRKPYERNGISPCTNTGQRNKNQSYQSELDKTQKNSKCRLSGDRDETINHIISECSKLAQKEYKTRHDWVGRVIHWDPSGRCGRNLNLTTPTNGVRTTQHMS